LSILSFGFTVQAQPNKVGRIGFLGFNDQIASKEFIEAFRVRLHELGYLEGKNVIVEYRWAEGKGDRLIRFSAELVALNVDVIFAAGALAIRAAKNATMTTPIVFEMLADPVSAGFVKSLSHPGGNLTGIGGLGPELSGKRVELLKEVVHGLKAVAVLANPRNPNFQSVLKKSRLAASALKLQLHVAEVSDPRALPEAFAMMMMRKPEALSVVPDSMLLGNHTTIVKLAAANRLPAVYGTSLVVANGGLMSYAPSQTEMWRRAATYVDKVLKGAKPADPPVEQPTKFELIINLKAAKQIGLTIPPNVLARADQVIK
jgi:putative ABC transport system substrate-binding protein